MLQGSRPSREDVPCTTCDLYLEGVKANQRLKRGMGRNILLLKNLGRLILNREGR